MNALKLEYDPCRGGFHIEFSSAPATSVHPILGGLFHLCKTKDSRIARLFCWDRVGGRFPGLHSNQAAFSRSFPLNEEGGKAGSVQVTQSLEQLGIWIGSVRDQQPSTLQDEEHSISVWIAENQVIGIRIGMRSIAAMYPFNSLNLAAEDLK